MTLVIYYSKILIIQRSFSHAVKKIFIFLSDDSLLSKGKANIFSALSALELFCYSRLVSLDFLNGCTFLRLEERYLLLFIYTHGK